MLYKATPLSATEKMAVQQLDEQTIFTCGGPLTMDGHQLHGQLVTRCSLRCSDPIEFAYFEKSKRYPKCCSLCGDADCELIVDPERKRLYRDVLPACERCLVQERRTPPVRYNTKFREQAKHPPPQQEAAAEGEGEAMEAPARASKWEGPMTSMGSDRFTEAHVAAFPKQCCRRPCQQPSCDVVFRAYPQWRGDVPGTVTYDQDGTAQGAVLAFRCTTCKGLWHYGCAEGMYKFTDDGVCILCRNADNAGTAAAAAARSGVSGGASSGAAAGEQGEEAEEGGIDSSDEESQAGDQEPDALSDDEYEVEKIIELHPSKTPMHWLVKWVGYPLNRDADDSWVARSAFTTVSSAKMLNEFERARKAAQKVVAAAAKGKKRKPQRSKGKGGRGAKPSNKKGKKCVIPADSSDDPSSDAVDSSDEAMESLVVEDLD